MLVKFFVIFAMVTGLFCTVTVKLPGTAIILSASLFYGAVTNFITFTPVITGMLVGIFAAAEIGGRILRIYLTRNYPVSRVFSVNCVASHFSGILASNALLGPFLGLVVWELIAGKTIIPRGDTIGGVILRLAGVAGFRFLCGITMIILIHIYIFI